MCNSIQLSENVIFRISPFCQVVQKHSTSYLRWIVKYLLIAYFIGNIFANKISKSIHVCESYSKPTVGRFLRPGVFWPNGWMHQDAT